MSNDTQRERLRWRLKPFPELVRLAWPIAVSMLSYSVMTLVDTVFAGRLGATAVGAVGFGGVVTFTLLCFGIGLIQGAKVLVAQAVGAGRRDKIAGHVGSALVLAVGVGACVGIVGQFVSLVLPAVADASTSVHLAQRYVSIRVLSAPAILVAFAIREIRCALGDSRSPMRTALIANTFHIPLNAALIFWAGLGVHGAAISTVIAQTLESLLLILVQRKEEGFGLSEWTRRDVEQLWQTGWPLGLERFFNVASFTLLVTLLARVGDTDLAAHQIANQLNLFALLPMFAFAEAAAVLTGQAVGANEDGLVIRVAKVAVLTGAAYGALCALVYVVLGPAIVGALTTDPGVQRVARHLLLIAAAWQAFDAVYLVAASVLRGAGDVRFATLAIVIVAWVVTPPLALLLALDLGLGAVGGWLALLAEWGTGAVILGTRVARSGWKRAAIRSRERLAEGDPLLIAGPVSSA
ncbi:MAG TPA: MATE family efflux transporter [Polyangiaceae bacterium]|nr:MATE family efflux transporter [Polyangiaceae bacterium]